MVAKNGVAYSSHSPPLVQQPSGEDSSLHPPTEDHVDDTHSDFGPNAPFWETPIGQDIASFGTRLKFSEEVSPNEGEHRKY